MVFTMPVTNELNLLVKMTSIGPMRQFDDTEVVNGVMLTHELYHAPFVYHMMHGVQVETTILNYRDEHTPFVTLTIPEDTIRTVIESMVHAKFVLLRVVDAELVEEDEFDALSGPPSP